MTQSESSSVELYAFGGGLWIDTAPEYSWFSYGSVSKWCTREGSRIIVQGANCELTYRIVDNDWQYQRLLGRLESRINSEPRWAG